MNRVYFDESGNTGQDLLNLADPVFTLCSCRLHPKQEAQALAHFASYQGPELKFTRLRKGDKGRQAILAFLEAPEVTASSFAAFVTHKPFMIVTKYCDIVVEPSMRHAGLDFYKRGLNVATANLLTTTMPVFLNPQTWNNFLAAFVRLVRERNHVAFREFLRLAELVYSYLEHTNIEMSHYIAAALLLRPDELLPMLSEYELDPLAPAYYVLANHWGKQLGEPFEIIADQNKILAKERARLLAFSSQDIRQATAGYDFRTVEFPLKISGITAVDSRAEKQVQLADVVCGAITRAAQSKNRFVEGSFERRILTICFEKKIIIGGVWPNDEIDPAQLGTDEVPSSGQFNLPTYTTMIMKEHPSTKRIRGDSDASE